MSGDSSATLLLRRIKVIPIVVALLASILLVVAVLPTVTTHAQPTIEINLDLDFYNHGDLPIVSVYDPNLDGSTDLEEIEVDISSDSDEVGFTLTLDENVADDGTFEGTFELTDIPPSIPEINLLYADEGGDGEEDSADTIYATYLADNTATAEMTFAYALFDKLLYESELEVATLEVFDVSPPGGTDPDSTDTVQVTVNSTSDGTGVTVDLEETGTNSLVFTGQLSFELGEPSEGELHVSNGDHLILTYDVPDDFTITTGADFGPASTISLDSESYDVDDTATIHVSDVFGNDDPLAIESVNVQVNSVCSEPGIDWDISETDIDSGEFEGNFTFTTSGSSSGTILRVCSDGDDIQATYLRSEPDIFVLDTATVNPVGSSFIEITSSTPAYFDVGVGLNGTTEVFGGSASITIDWDDDEATTVLAPTANTWTLDSSLGHEYGSEEIGETFDIVATLTYSDPDCPGGTCTEISEPFPITVLKHPTEIDIDFINEDTDPESKTLDSVPVDAKYSVVGTIFDIADGRKELADKTISFNIAEAGSLPSVVSQGIVFEHPLGGKIEVVDCPNSSTDCSEDLEEIFGADPDSEGNNVLHLEVGGQIIFPEDSNTLSASLYIQDIGFDKVRFNVYDADGLDHEGEVIGAGGGACVIPIIQTEAGTTVEGAKQVPQPITMIEITEVLSDSDLEDPDLCGPMPLTDGPAPPISVPDGTLGIAAIITHLVDGHDPFTKQFIVNFEDETVEEKTSPYEVNPGRFSSTALTDVPIGDNYEFQASFDGSSDPLYDSSFSDIGEIDISTARGGLTSAVAGSTSTTVIKDNGNDFVTYSCAAGNDVDGDAICDNWEESGIVDVGGASYVLCTPFSASNPCDGDDGLFNTKDIYVEIDAMTGFEITTTTRNELMAVFSNGPAAPNGFKYKLHLDTSAGASDVIPVSWPTKIWTDTSSAKLGGTQVNSMTATSATVKVVKVSGLKLTTTGAVPCTKITIKQFIDIPGSLTGAVGAPSVDVADGSASLNIAPAGCGFVAATIAPSSGSNPSYTITYEIPFTTSAAITNVDIGRLKVTLTLGSPGFAGTIAPGALFKTQLGSPIIKGNDDYDGMKKNFFGTEQERLTAGGTLGQDRPNLIAKALVTHWALGVRTMGPNQATCGSSGWAEFNGNDFIYALGSKRVSGVDVPCFTGTAGSTIEKKGTFLHELGHNLGLRHNGYGDENCAPNYPSVMNYARQIQLGGFGAYRLDFSRQNLLDLDERVGFGNILEASGLPLSIPTHYPAGTTIDIVYGNGAGTKLGPVTVSSVVTPINWNGDSDGTPTSDTLDGFDINHFSTIKGCETAGTLSNLLGHDDYDFMDLNFRDGNPIDGTHYPLPVPEDVDDQVYQSLLDTSNDGRFSGLLSPIKPAIIDALTDLLKAKKRDAIPLKFTYVDFSGNPITNADLELRLFKIVNGEISGPPITPVPHTEGQGNNFVYDPATQQWRYTIISSSLPVGTYGCEVWLDGIGTGIKLDNNTDGFAGFFMRVN